MAGSAVQKAVSVARETWGTGLDFDFYYSNIICMVWIWVLSQCQVFFFPHWFSGRDILGSSRNLFLNL